MKIFAPLFFLFLVSQGYSQMSEDLIPKDAVSVFSINNINLLQKISLDDLVKYEFMEEVQQELFDGSTAGKTIKDSGIDFDQKLNVFFGKGLNYELSGFTFGVSNRNQLFDVFDDFQPIESDYDNVDFYLSYFNRIAIKNNAGILFRISPNMDLVNTITDSIWYARGNEYPWYEYEEGFNDIFKQLDSVDYNPEEDIEFFDEMEIEENTATPIENIEFPVAEEDPSSKTYYELRDSIEVALQNIYLKEFCDDLFVNGNNLVKASSEFKSQLSHDSEGVFFFDNSRSLSKNSDYSSLRLLFPSLYKNLQTLYDGNILLGDLVLNDQSIELKLDVNYGPELGSIYQKMTDAKFDKNISKYIHKENSSFFTYKVNLREAYEQSYKVIMPMLEQESNAEISVNILVLELLNEFLNKDAIFDTYKGGMFGTYNGIKKVKTKKIIFDYNEDNFEYTEEEVEAEEDMPIFAIGFSTDRSDIPEKILKHVSRLTNDCHNEGDYWVFDQAVLNAAPLYMINKNGLFIFTNDENLAVNHSDGFGSNSMNKVSLKSAKKSGFLYGYADLGKAIESLPKELFNDDQNELIDVIRGKSGKIEVTSTEASPNKTSFNFSYKFEGEYDASGTYILDLINSLYVISK